MGWNGKSGQEVSYIINWRDSVGDETIDEFDTELQAKVRAFIAQQIRERFAKEIENDTLNFMCGEFDSYTVGQ